MAAVLRIKSASGMDIAAHRANPEFSFERHVKSRVVALGRSLDGRAAIYLDTKFWIVLRDCAAGRNSDPAVQELLVRLAAHSLPSMRYAQR